MNLKLPLAAILAAFVYPTALQAATWTVDNNAAHNANFTSLQAAIDAASEDDTLLVAGSGTSYGDVTSSKRLKIRGPGYFQVENSVTPHLGVAQLGTLIFSKIGDVDHPNFGRSAGGSVVEGMTIGSFGINAGCDNVSVRRCLVGVGFSTALYPYASGCTILQSFVDDTIDITGSSNLIANCYVSSISGNTGVSNVVSNCVVGGTNGIPSGWVSWTNSGGPQFQSCILISQTGSWDTDCFYDHCMAVGGGVLPTANGNVNGAVLANVFVQTGTERAVDRYYRLKAASPAIGTGVGGADMGMFGGSAPYLLGGIPALPRITNVALPAVVVDSPGLQFQVTAEARE